MAKLSTKKRNSLSSGVFGLPEKRMFPMNDKEHVIKAEQLLNAAKITPAEKAKVKRKIAKRKKELGMK